MQFRADLGALLPREVTERAFPDLNCLLIRTIRYAIVGTFVFAARLTHMVRTRSVDGVVSRWTGGGR